MVLFGFLRLHTDLKDLTLILIQGLVCQGAAIKRNEINFRNKDCVNLLVLANNILWSYWAHTMVGLCHDTVQVELNSDFKEVARRYCARYC